MSANRLRVLGEGVISKESKPWINTRVLDK